MVVFSVIFRNGNEIRYEYFPEGDKNSTAGIIGMERDGTAIEVIQPAEREICIPIDDKGLSGQQEGEIHYVYAEHVVRKIKAAYEKGIILEGGTAVWY